VSIGRSHHRDLYVLIAQSGDTPSPFALDRSPSFQLQAEFPKEINRGFDVVDDDPYIVHAFDWHVANLQGVVSPNKPRAESVQLALHWRIVASNTQA